MRHVALIGATTVALMSLLFLAGNADDAGCGGGGGVKTAKTLCLDTGGTWDDSSCPSACWPPTCGAPLPQACISVCGSEPVCTCPGSKPYWEDGQGCLGPADCPSIFCGGFAGIQCPAGMTCKLDGSYPDAGGKCVPAGS